ncbi:MAG: hypothetical protein ACRESX_12375 [Gammaproteobacteria bacterium]
MKTKPIYWNHLHHMLQSTDKRWRIYADDHGGAAGFILMEQTEPHVYEPRFEHAQLTVAKAKAAELNQIPQPVAA